MFEQYFNLIKTPFTRDIPENELLNTVEIEELCGRLEYVARNRLFAVVTGDVGSGKTTAIRKLVSNLDNNRYRVMYISDSALTPRNFYWEVLNQLGCEAKFYRSDAKRQLTRELTNLIEIHKKIPVIIVDEAHLLTREMLEEVRFLLNSKMDSYNPMSLILVGQSELKDVLKKQIYEAICQRIDIRYHLSAYDRQQTGEYIKKHPVRRQYRTGLMSKIDGHGLQASCGQTDRAATTVNPAMQNENNVVGTQVYYSSTTVVLHAILFSRSDYNAYIIILYCYCFCAKCLYSLLFKYYISIKERECCARTSFTHYIWVCFYILSYKADICI